MHAGVTRQPCNALAFDTDEDLVQWLHAFGVAFGAVPRCAIRLWAAWIPPEGEGGQCHHATPCTRH
jgi:hypothetical protein